MLSDIGGKHCVLRHIVGDDFHDVPWAQPVFRIFKIVVVFVLPVRNLLKPLTPLFLFEKRHQHINHIGDICDHTNINVDILVNLGRVDVDLDYLGICELVDVGGHPVGKAGS
ncbi:hypothetical protein SDC9_83123 [bioreactor metagenome]|uniref:Uncharacterized protein n=1 Tax=bioreactor metagenome TaxID=1076179 RepID=A0A644Z6L2_9ZZZZ